MRFCWIVLLCALLAIVIVTSKSVSGSKTSKPGRRLGNRKLIVYRDVSKGHRRPPGLRHDDLDVKLPKNPDGFPHWVRNPRRWSQITKMPRATQVQYRYNKLMKTMKWPPSIQLLRTPLPRLLTRQIFNFLRRFHFKDSIRPPGSALPPAMANYSLGVEKTYRSKALQVLWQLARRQGGQNKIIFGRKEVIHAIEHKQAKLVLISGDVDPVLRIVYLPYLCRKLCVPYAIHLGGRRRLKIFLGRRATIMAVVSANADTEGPFQQLLQEVNKEQEKIFNEVVKINFPQFNCTAREFPG